jgi:hypothetical protein
VYGRADHADHRAGQDEESHRGNRFGSPGQNAISSGGKHLRDLLNWFGELIAEALSDVRLGDDTANFLIGPIEVDEPVDSDACRLRPGTVEGTILESA